MESVVFDVEKIVRLAEKLGASEAEVTLVSSKSSIAEATRNTLERLITRRTATLGVRVATGKQVGAAGGEVADASDIEEIVRRAVSLAKTSSPDPNWPGFNPIVGLAGSSVEVYHDATASLTGEDLSRILNRQVEMATSREGVTIASASLSAGEGVTIIANSYGGPVEEKSTSTGYWVEVKARINGKEGTYYSWFSSARFDDKTVEETTRDALARAFDAANAVPAKSTRGPVILVQREAAMLIDTLISPAVSAYNVQLGRSPLKGKLGEKVFSHSLTITDDPFIPWETGSGRFDDEGHPTTRKNIVEKGVLKTFLYDHYTASIEGRESTGNGFKFRPWNNPSPSPTNLVIDVKDARSNIADVISDIKEGMLVASTIGAWLSNPISGQINATANLAYMIRNGEIGSPVKGAVLGGDIYENLGEGLVTAAGDLQCYHSVCTRMLVLNKLRVAGSS